MKTANSTIAPAQPKAAVDKPMHKPTRARGAKRPAQTAPWNEPEVDDDPVATDMDEFRYELARRIRRFIANRTGAWRRCPEPACKRHRVCAARNSRCRDAPPRKPDPDGRNMARVLAKVQRALREVQARRAEEGR